LSDDEDLSPKAPVTPPCINCVHVYHFTYETSWSQNPETQKLEQCAETPCPHARRTIKQDVYKDNKPIWKPHPIPTSASLRVGTSKGTKKDTPPVTASVTPEPSTPVLPLIDTSVKGKKKAKSSPQSATPDSPKLNSPTKSDQRNLSLQNNPPPQSKKTLSQKKSLTH
jgi:hypothetical protein